MRTGQKYHRGDLVRVAKKMPSTMSHFSCDCDAIVVGSYNDVCPNHARKGDCKQYELLLHPDTPTNPDHGRVAWYYEDQLTLIETGNEETRGLLAAYERKHRNQ